MQYEMITVTPELAETWLKKNSRNRSFSPGKAKTYAADMSAGRWKHTHQDSIAFYKDGELADGQHRLAAISLSGVPRDLMVWWGLEDDAAYGIDAHKMRGTSDQIKIAHRGSWVRHGEIAVAKMMHPTAESKGWSSQQIIEFCETHKPHIEYAMSCISKSSAPSPVRAAIAICHMHETESMLNEWCAVMENGVTQFPRDRTVIALRDKLLKEKTRFFFSRAGRETLLKMTMHSVHAHCRDKVLTKILEPKNRAYEIR